VVLRGEIKSEERIGTALPFQTKDMYLKALVVYFCECFLCEKTKRNEKDQRRDIDVWDKNKNGKKQKKKKN
jgi:hypothetical protein